MARMLDTRTKTVRLRIASQDRITVRQARDWALWAAAQCGVPTHSIQTPAPCRWQMFCVQQPTRGLTHLRARARNSIYRDRARETYLSRCRVAWYMHTVPNPLFDSIASQAVIAAGMGFATQQYVCHAIARWESHKRNQNGGEIA